MSPEMRAASPTTTRRHRRHSALVLRALLLTGVLLSAASASASASTLSFTGGFSSDWNTAANWTNTTNTTLHAVPTAADDARIPLGAAPVLAGGDGAARSLVLDAGASLSVSGRQLTLAGGAPSTFAGSLALSGTASLQLGGASPWSGGNWSLNGSTITNSGTLSITGDVTATGVGVTRVTNTNTGTITRADGDPTSGTAVFTTPLVNNGTFAVSAGTADLRGGGGLDAGTFTVASQATL